MTRVTACLATIVLCVLVAPLLATALLAGLLGEPGLFFGAGDIRKVIPFSLFLPLFVFPLTGTAAAASCLLGAWGLGRGELIRSWRWAGIFSGLGLGCGIVYPGLMSLAVMRSTSGTLGVGGQADLWFLAAHWIAGGGTGLVVGFLISVVWYRRWRRTQGEG